MVRRNINGFDNFAIEGAYAMTKAKLLIAAAAVSTPILVLATSATMAQQMPCGPYQGYGWHQQPGHGWQQGMGPGNPQLIEPQGVGPRFMVRFAAIDKDQNGVVSAEEAADNVETVFYEMDADEDEAVTPEEFMAVRMGPGARYNPARQQAMQTQKAARFEEMDTDNDSFVNKREFMSAGEKRFAASDADKDGKVTPWEFRSSRRRF